MAPTDHPPFADPGIGVYIHFPFCRRHCRYCHFTTAAFKPAAAENYLELLQREIELRAHPDRLARTLYLGGGSPSLLSLSQIRELKQSLADNFPHFEPVESSIEANPEDLNPEWLQEAVSNGFNRISIGVQSLQEEVLHYLGRNHTPETSLQAISLARQAGFANINVDLMIGIPGQTPRAIHRQVLTLGELPVTHLSIYMLEQTPDDTRSNECVGAKLYLAARDAAADTGFMQYEVSSFARPGAECRHNLIYWRNQEYQGIGLAAAGFLDGIDLRNTGRMPSYCRGIRTGRPVHSRRRIAPEQRRLVTGLRLTEGVPISAVQSRLDALQPLLEENVLYIAGNRLAVTPDRMLMLNEILARYVL